MTPKLYRIIKQWVRHKRIMMAYPHFRHGRMLDVGCGDAGLSLWLSWKYYEYYGVDKNLNGLHNRRDLIEADIEDIRQRRAVTGRYETIVMLAVLEHLDNPGEVLAWCQEKLAPGGVLVLTTPTTLGDWIVQKFFGIKLDHKTIFNKGMLYEYCQAAGLEVTRYRRFEFGANQLVVARKDYSDVL